MTQLAQGKTSDPVTRRTFSPRVLVASVLLAGVGAIVIAQFLTGTGYQPAPFGLPDAGRLTAIGLPIAQYVHELAGIAVVGLLLLRMITPGDGPDSRHLGVMTARWGWVWVGSTVVWILFTLSTLIGVPVTELASKTDLIVEVSATNRVVAEMATLWVALAVALFGSAVSGTARTGAALLIAAAAVLPSALNGHAGHHSSPTLAVVVLGVHVVAAAVWVGGLLALIVHLRRYPDLLRTALPRFSVVALICVLAIGFSGVFEGFLELDSWAEVWGTDRGQLMLAKTVALLVLAGFGYLHRRRTMPAAGTGRLFPLLRLASLELILMGATVAIAVVLSNTA